MTDDNPLARDDASDAPASSQASALAIVGRMAPASPASAEMLSLLSGPLGQAIETAATFADGRLAASTKRAYERDWRGFAAWCRTQKVDPAALPVHPVLVAAYLASLVPALGKSGLQARLAAIAHHHHEKGHLWSARHPAITGTLQGILRQHGKPIRPSAALTSTEIRQLLGSCGGEPGGAAGSTTPAGFASPGGLTGPAGSTNPGGSTSLAGVRDRALFLTGFAGALRRSELVAIDREHLKFLDVGLTIHIPRSKRDQEGQGADITIPWMRGEDTCPVKAMERWLKRAGITHGAVFRGVTAWGTLENRLTADGVRKILVRRAALAGLTVDPRERLSPHGLRAGFITEAYLAAAPDEQVMAHTRQKDVSTMRGYRRRAKITGENPARLLDL
ncbi:site-specific integrase [Acidisphaera sp. L21]|uniref:site-specific integrase n=1 Tax=Acidisphaera sp. L21 TaxID=1641851 RepID=UPI00131DF251|nr:tyrosine-type recombinase/integrase [Acidisphaera sp. L21]